MLWINIETIISNAIMEIVSGQATPSLVPDSPNAFILNP